MGKAPAKAAAKTAPSAKGGKGKGPAVGERGPLISPANRLLLMLTLLALVPFSLPTLLLLFVGMLPTLAAVFIERGSARQAWVSVGGFNFAGLSNWLLSLWFAHQTFGYAISELRSITPLVVAYAAAAMGWGLHLAMPPLVNAVTTVTSQRRVLALTEQQRKLVEQWGDGVISREPVKTGEAPAAAPGAPAPGAAAAASSAPARGRA